MKTSDELMRIGKENIEKTEVNRRKSDKACQQRNKSKSWLRSVQSVLETQQQQQTN